VWSAALTQCAALHADCRFTARDTTCTLAALITAIGIAINFPCVSTWALFGVAIRRALTDVRRQRAFNAIMAASPLALALTLLL
jgi:threonine/homoserine/homoserine lactone efflux protein